MNIPLLTADWAQITQEKSSIDFHFKTDKFPELVEKKNLTEREDVNLLNGTKQIPLP